MKNLTILILTIAVMFCLQNAFAVENAGFETAGAGGVYSASSWNSDAGDQWFGRSSEAAHSGTYCWKNSTNKAWGGAIQSTNIANLEGKTVTLKAYAMTPSSSRLEEKIIIKFEWIGASGNKESYPFPSVDSWTEYSSGSAVAPAGATGVKIVLINNGSLTGTVYFDDVTLDIVAPPIDTNVANGSFELGSGMDAYDWTEDNRTELQRTSAQARTGSYSMGLIHGWDWINTKQTMSNPNLAGKIINFSAYGLQPSSDPLTGNAIIKMNYKDSGGSTLGSEQAWFMNAGSSKDTWIKGNASGTAPAGTVALQLILMKENGDGSLYYDDVNVDIIPEPVVLMQIGLLLGMFALRFRK